MCDQSALLQKIVEDTFTKVSYLKDNVLDWQAVLATSHSATSEYVASTIHYHKAYLSTATDLSITIFENNIPVAIWPLTLYQIGDIYTLQSNCKHIIPPVFVVNTSKKTIKKIYQQCFNSLKAFSASTNNNIFLTYCPLTDVLWQRIFSPAIEAVNYQQFLIADLSDDIVNIKKSFRKSYRSLINKGMKLWQPQLHTHMSDDLLNQFRDFHIQVSGKETRSFTTWKLQQKMVNNQEAFCISIHDDNSKLIAIGLFNISPLQASYSVGVYDRELFDLPLGHIIQFEAITYMKKLGVQRYFLGHRSHLFEQPKPTEKEHSIGFFKEGFSNEIHIEANVTLVFS
ncbi:hypothetical protein [Colwellia sp. E2M01]|uniref:hypothetical protein n=1 Tax=Colwellia sp. E2M01 TaxID=2841561 RepID=UPI001C0A4015|nr:hypothetical protein [Colwellia sp. E2M01]MBU2869968.1 hypothetical protein [Colwellia sp. E2M01]